LLKMLQLLRSKKLAQRSLANVNLASVENLEDLKNASVKESASVLLRKKWPKNADLTAKSHAVPKKWLRNVGLTAPSHVVRKKQPTKR